MLTPAKESISNSKTAEGWNRGPFFKPIILHKLTINPPNDLYEQEADAIAEQVMKKSMTNLTAHRFFTPACTSLIQSKCAECEKEEHELPKNISRRETGDSNIMSTHNVEQTLQSPGQPLDNITRDFMEGRFGYDFSNVQI